jgi:hypothetical protein
MTYDLYRLHEFGAAATDPALGHYPDFDAALDARDRDVIAQLRTAPMPPREMNHLIVGPGVRGPRTQHPLVTFAGTTVTDPDPAAEIAATATWLDAIRRR